MLRNIKQPKAKKPVMVMLHGSGSSAAIFGIQTRLLAKELSRKFDLVFLDAPTPSAPGPGVLPVFAEMPGYYRWLAPELSASLRLMELLNVARYLQAQLDLHNIEPSEVVACLGFSQGALVALAMLGLRLAEQSVWQNLRFAVAIGAGTTGKADQMDGVQNLVSRLSTMLGREDGKFPGYSVHASGLRDLWYKDGRRLANICARDRTKSMDYRDGHVVPRQKHEVLKLVQMVMSIDEASKATSPSTESSQALCKESMLSLLDGGDSKGDEQDKAKGIELQA